eukprot:GHVS01095337.1.p1 GENE.GHVS01095337.1~~GHVS01095337.1.p1  ORF type:complete len:290 (+),score=47.85 GHVS01095337.1:130-999(+)
MDLSAEDARVYRQQFGQQDRNAELPPELFCGYFKPLRQACWCMSLRTGILVLTILNVLSAISGLWDITETYQLNRLVLLQVPPAVNKPPFSAGPPSPSSTSPPSSSDNSFLATTTAASSSSRPAAPPSDVLFPVLSNNFFYRGGYFYNRYSLLNVVMSVGLAFFCFRGYELPATEKTLTALSVCTVGYAIMALILFLETGVMLVVTCTIMLHFGSVGVGLPILLFGIPLVLTGVISFHCSHVCWSYRVAISSEVGRRHLLPGGEHAMPPANLSGDRHQESQHMAVPWLP